MVRGWFICWLIIFKTCLSAAQMTDTAATTSGAPLNNNFYSYSCSADTFVPSIKTFSSIWAIVNGIIFFGASLLFLRHLCFVRFISHLTK
ncbi:orf 53 [Ateline gammaherpesvirus 3]|uniref:Orf 53 n=1 Tax=Ateline herpesvirus 3 TaxID=85618 RepID=Q9YTL3_ATHV3|nr:orf 53 [Ateline gammaherpesvirus 3]AAC95578.1 orf 53 [Ateline gammaherpesvirus 3]